MTNTIVRNCLLFLFVAVSVLGLSPEKASAQIPPFELYTAPFYYSDQPVTVWHSYWKGYRLYWLDKIPPKFLTDLALSSPFYEPIIIGAYLGTWWSFYQWIYYGADVGYANAYNASGIFSLSADEFSFNLGKLSVGSHTIYGSEFVYGMQFQYMFPQSIRFSSKTFNVCVPTYLTSCSKSANSCGVSGYATSDWGTVNCDGSCSVSGVSAELPYWNNSYTVFNSCGDSVTRYTDCNGQVDSTPPPNRAGYGSSCSTSTNSCGEPNAGYMTTCNANGTVSCAIYYTPSVPSYYGTACTLTSLPNACGRTNTTSGTLDCNYTCTGTPPAPPSNAVCAPSAPTISGLYQSGVYRGSSVPAYDPLGYQIYANATSPAGYNLTYYFEFSTDGINWSGDPAPAQWATLPP